MLWLKFWKAKGQGSLTDTLHGLVGGALAWRAADITSPTVWIQALLTFCAKIAIETRFTIVYFTFWKTKREDQMKGSNQFQSHCFCWWWEFILLASDFWSSGNTEICIVLIIIFIAFLQKKRKWFSGDRTKGNLNFISSERFISD